MLFCVSKSDIFNFADDNTLSPCGKILGDILHNFKLDIRCFKVNSLKRNPDKLPFMILGAKTDIK